MSKGKRRGTSGAAESGVNHKEDSESRPSPPINTSRTFKGSSAASATVTFELRKASFVRLYAQKLVESMCPLSDRRCGLKGRSGETDCNLVHYVILVTNRIVSNRQIKFIETWAQRTSIPNVAPGSQSGVERPFFGVRL